MEPQYQTILNKADPYLDVIRAATSKYNLDLPKFISQIAQESSFNPNAMSKAGAVGISQFMPATAKMYGLTDRTDPVASIEAQARHMSDLLNANNGNYDLALAAYNAGQGRVNKAGGIPNIRETKDYIKKINLMSEGLSKMLHPDLQDQLNQPATVPNQQIQPAATVPFAQQNTQKNGTLVDTITALMAGLGGLGGNVANIIGGIKGTGSPGDQALKSSAGLLEILSTNQEKARNAQRINDFFNQSKASPEMKNAAMALAKMGDTKGAMDLLTQPIKDDSYIKRTLATETAKLTSPEIQNAKAQQLQSQSDISANKELNVYKGKAAFDDAQRNKKLEEWQNISSKTLLTPEDQARKKLLESDLKIKNGLDAIENLEMRKTAYKILNTDLKPAVSLYKDLTILKDTLNKMSTGPASGRLTDLKTMFVGDEKNARANAALGRLLTNFSRSVAGEKGVLTDQDIERVQAAIANNKMTIAERNAVMNDAFNALQGRIKTAANEATFVVGTDLTPYINSIYGVSLSPAESILQSGKRNTASQQHPTSNSMSIEEKAKSLGATIRIK